MMDRNTTFGGDESDGAEAEFGLCNGDRINCVCDPVLPHFTPPLHFATKSPAYVITF